MDICCIMDKENIQLKLGWNPRRDEKLYLPPLNDKNKKSIIHK